MHEIITPKSLGDVDGVIWYNGKIVDWRQANVHFLSHSLHYASAVFEGIRVYNRKVFQPVPHLQRLKQGARTLGMTIRFSQKVLLEAVEEAVGAQKIIDGYVRPLVWRGPGPMDFNPKHNPPNIAIAAWPLDTFLKDGARLVLSEFQRPSPRAGPWRTKATGLYLSATLAKAAAKQRGYDDALMLSWKGNLADTTGTNIFCAIDGRLYTPRPDGFFAGLTMQTVMGLAKKCGIETCIQDIPARLLSKAQEVFLTGTAAGIVSVREICLRKISLRFERAAIADLVRQHYKEMYTYGT